jgi:hypothetical protein
MDKSAGERVGGVVHNKHVASGGGHHKNGAGGGCRQSARCNRGLGERASKKRGGRERWLNGMEWEEGGGGR